MFSSVSKHGQHNEQGGGVILGSFLETLGKLGLVRLGLISAILAGVAGGLYYTAQKFSEPDMALLYSELDMGDASKIVSRIEGMGVPVELRGAGTQIYVPADKVARLRMEMAEAGLPRGGTVGYEIFDKTDTLGVTDFVQDINHVRALEGELARSIASLSTVSTARVHLVLPRRELFSRDRQQPSASIILKINGPGRLSPSKVQAIQHLAASAVPQLSPDRISVVDDQGNLLARGESNPEAVTASNLEEIKLSHENRLSQIIENLSERYVGPGKVRAEVSVDVNYDRITENSEKYDPEGQVLRSSQTVEEGDNSTESGASGGGQEAGVQGNLPNGPAAGGTGGDKTSSQSKKTEETLNYEISKSITTHIKESGGIKRLSVAVMVDGIYTKGPDGKNVYKPRPPAEMETLKKLIASAIGFNAERKDQLEVVNMPFAPLDEKGELGKDEETFLGFQRRDVVRLAETLIFGFLGLLALLLVIKPLVGRLLSTFVEEDSGGGVQGRTAGLLTDGRMAEGGALSYQNTTPQDAYGGASRPRQIAGPASGLTGEGRDAASDASAGGGLQQGTTSPIEQMISMKKIEGQVRASSIQQVGAIIEERPDDAVTIVRNWMHEGRT